MTKEEIKKQVNVLETQFKNFAETINALKAKLDKVEHPETFEVGKIYRSRIGNAIARFCKLGYNNYAICHLNWINDQRMTDINQWQPVTVEKWKKALIDYAKRKGFKAGVTVCRGESLRKMYGLYIPEKVEILNDDFVYFEEIDALLLGKKTIYRQGEWATIVEEKEEPIMVGGVEVKFPDKGLVTIGNYTYEYNEINRLLVHSIRFNEPITNELLTKIKNRIK